MIEELSSKQFKSLKRSNSRINIFEGAVRSGKSFISLIRWLEFIRSGPPGNLILVGRTDRTIKRNIIDPLHDLVGNAVSYSIGKGEVTLYGRTMFVVGANDERAEAKIRGSEFAGALIDELTLIPESFFKMLLSRLSVRNAKLFATTNPDSPFHWVKRDFIDRKDELDLSVFSYNIYDNPSLPKEVVEALKKEYRGLWYTRFIEGKWVLAEGAVYDFFEEKTHVIDFPPGPADYYIVGVDYGTTNPCAFVMIGHNPYQYPNTWLEKEYYFDSKISQRQKSDYEYAQDFIDFVQGFNVKQIYIDPSAASFKRELQRQGIDSIKDAENEVLAGIRYQATLLSSGAYKICSNCTNAIKEYMTYVWDAKSTQRGLDKPLKQNDHIKDAERYALYTHFFNKSIKSMSEEEAVAMERAYYLKK